MTTIYETEVLEPVRESIAAYYETGNRLGYQSVCEAGLRVHVTVCPAHIGAPEPLSVIVTAGLGNGLMTFPVMPPIGATNDREAREIADHIIANVRYLGL